MILRDVDLFKISRNSVLFLLSLYCSCFLVYSQNSRLINMEDISQRKVRVYIRAKLINQMDDFSQIRPSWKNDIPESEFHLISQKFLIKKKLADVWDYYSHIDLKESFDRHSVRFALLLKKYTNTAVYANDLTTPVIDTGQIYFLNLRLIRGLMNIPVAFEIINIDSEKKIVEFSYIDNNKSKGKQTLQFLDNGDGSTSIMHLSYFKSNSNIRDAVLYPPFHRKFIKEFHRSMKPGI